MWEIRRASLADRDALVEVCSAAAGPNDYPIAVMEDMILRGVWHVALDRDRLIGAMHYRDALDGSGWLAAARTHPSYRRRGVASALLASFVGLAQRKGAPSLRLWSEAANDAGRASAASAGFREVAKFSRVTQSTARAARSSAPVAFSDALLSRLQASRLLRLARGYLPYASTFLSSSPPSVYLLCAKRSLRETGDGIVCMSHSGEGSEETVLECGVAAGGASAVLRSLARAGAGLGFEEVAACLPCDPDVLASARLAGFRPASWGREAILFEKWIEVRPVPRRTRPTYAELAARSRMGLAALAPSLANRRHSRHDVIPKNS